MIYMYMYIQCISDSCQILSKKQSWLYKWVPNSHFGYKFYLVYTEAVFNYTDIDYYILAQLALIIWQRFECLLVKVGNTLFF